MNQYWNYALILAVFHKPWFEKYEHMLLIWCHSLTSPRSLPPVISDPTRSEITRFQMAETWWKNYIHLFFRFPCCNIYTMSKIILPAGEQTVKSFPRYLRLICRENTKLIKLIFKEQENQMTLFVIRAHLFSTFNI